MTNVINLPVPGKSVDEAMAWLNQQHADTGLVDILAIAVDKEGHYVFAGSKMCGKGMLYLVTYLRERVMETLRHHGIMPGPTEP